MLPSSYRAAELRCVQPMCQAREVIGIAFNVLEVGRPITRVALGLEDATMLRDCLTDYINSAAGTQSPGSPLIDSLPKSDPSDGVNV